jgi:hypothetical protein
MPRRRRGAAAMAVEAPAERGLAMRILLHSPKDTVAGLVAFAAVSAIITNALFLQAGHHPSPMFGNVVVMPAAELPLPRPRPVEVMTRPAELLPLDQKNSEQKILEPKVAEPKAAEPKAAEPKAADPLANLLKATGAPPAAASSIPRPPAPIPSAGPTVGSRRVAAVQRTLTEYGYGQLKPTGTIGSDTQAAIQKFERERRMPVTGQMSDRLVHELAAMIGHPID